MLLVMPQCLRAAKGGILIHPKYSVSLERLLNEPGLKEMFHRTGLDILMLPTRWIEGHHCMWFRQAWDTATQLQLGDTFMLDQAMVQGVISVRCLNV